MSDQKLTPKERMKIPRQAMPEQEAAERRQRRSALRAEAQLTATDPADLAQARRVRDAMDTFAVSWPES